MTIREPVSAKMDKRFSIVETKTTNILLLEFFVDFGDHIFRTCVIWVEQSGSLKMSNLFLENDKAKMNRESETVKILTLSRLVHLISLGRRALAAASTAGSATFPSSFASELSIWIHKMKNKFFKKYLSKHRRRDCELRTNWLVLNE